MGVFTQLTENEVGAAVKYFGAGALVSFEGIAAGVENTNYRLETTGGEFVLTIFEGRTEVAKLPYFLKLMAHLADKGIACPRPLSGNNGAIFELAGKPVGVLTWLEGDWPREPHKQQAKALGNIRVGRFPLLGNGKAVAINDADGMVKTIFDQTNGALLGAHMIGPGVTELIQGFAVAMGLETTESDLIETIFPHPTISEAMHESVLSAFDRTINF